MRLFKIDLTDSYQKVSSNMEWWIIRDRVSLRPAVANSGTLSLAMSETPWTDEIISLWNWQWLTVTSPWIDVDFYAKSSVASGDVLYIVEN